MKLFLRFSFHFIFIVCLTVFGNFVFQTHRFSRCAKAAGPLSFDEATGDPTVWADRRVFYNLDSGPLGTIPEAQARDLVRKAFQNWLQTPDAEFSVREAGPIRDKTGAVVDVTNDNLEQVIDLEGPDGSPYPLPDGQSPIIFDNGGKILDRFFGPGSGVIGLAGFEIVDSKPPHRALEGIALLNGAFVDGDPKNSNGIEFTPEEFQGVVTHEIGHYLGLGHSQVNGPSIVFGRDVFGFGEAPVDSVETMFPFSTPKTGVAAGTPARDDQVGLATLYPRADFRSRTASLSGRVFQPDAVTPLQGADVIVRNVADPFFDAVSQLSGARYVPPFFTSALTSRPPGPAELENYYELNGLAPGAEYVVSVEPTTGGGFSSVISFGYEREFFSGVRESGNPETDAPELRSPIKTEAGKTTDNVNLVLNADSSKVLLAFPRTAVAAVGASDTRVTVGIPSPAPAGGVQILLKSRNPNVFDDARAVIPEGATAVPVALPRKAAGSSGFDVEAVGYAEAAVTAGAAQKPVELLPFPASTPATSRLAVGEILLGDTEPPFRFRVRTFDADTDGPAKFGRVLAELPEVRGPNKVQARLTQLAYGLDGKTVYAAQGFAGSSLFVTASEAASVAEKRAGREVVQVNGAVVWRLTDGDGDGVAERMDYFETGTADVQELVVASTSSGEAVIVSSNFSDANEFFNRLPGTTAALKPSILAFPDRDGDGRADGGTPRTLITTDQLAVRDLTELSGGMAIDRRDRLFFSARNTLRALAGILIASDTDADGLPDKLELFPYAFTNKTNLLTGLARFRLRESDDAVIFSTVTVTDLNFVDLAGEVYVAPDADRDSKADGFTRLARELGLNNVSPNLTNSGLELGARGEVFVVGTFPGFRAGPLILPQYAVYRVIPRQNEVSSPTVFALGHAVDVENQSTGFLTGLARGIDRTKFAPVLTEFSIKKKTLTLTGRRFRSGLKLSIDGKPVAAKDFTVSPEGIVLPKGKKLLPGKKKVRAVVVNPDGQTAELTVGRN